MDRPYITRMIIRSPFARPGGLRTALRAFNREEKLYTMMRILLFLATNLAVLVIASITLKLLGVDRFTGQNYGSLLVFCAVFGFAGSLVSLFISKWMAKMSTGTEVISQPRTRHEQWLLQTVEELSREAGIKMPEVGIFPPTRPTPSPPAGTRTTRWSRSARACSNVSRPMR